MRCAGTSGNGQAKILGATNQSLEKPKSRDQLKDKTVVNILVLHINGNIDVSKDKSVQYAIIVVAGYVLVNPVVFPNGFMGTWMCLLL